MNKEVHTNTPHQKEKILYYDMITGRGRVDRSAVTIAGDSIDMIHVIWHDVCEPTQLMSM